MNAVEIIKNLLANLPSDEDRLEAISDICIDCGANLNKEKEGCCRDN